MTQDQHVGKLRVAVNIGISCSPGLRCYLSADTDVPALIDRANAELEELIARIFPDAEQPKLPWPIVHLAFPTEVVRPESEQQTERAALWESIRIENAIASEINDTEIDNNQHNGKLGWWRVSGMRHGALVRASSEREAITKASEIVQSWEDPRGEWIGEELPDIIDL